MTKWVETNWKWLENECFCIKTFFESIKVSFCLEGCTRTFFDLCFFYLWHSNFNLQTSTYIFYKSTTQAKIEPVASGTVLRESALSGRKICSFCNNTYTHSVVIIRNSGISFWFMTAKYDPFWINNQGGCRVIWCLVMCLSDWLYKARTYNGTFNGTFFFALLTCIHGFSHATFRFKRNFKELQFLPYFCLPVYVMFHLQRNLWKENFIAERTTTKKLFISHSYQWFKAYSKSAWDSQKNLKKQR